MLQAITFDFWWTLYADDHPEAADAWRLEHLGSVLAAAGHPVSPGALARATGDVRQQNERQQEDHGLDWTPEEQIDLLLRHLELPLDLAPRLLAPWTGPLLHFPPRPMPGAADTLAALARRYRLAVICNTGASPGHVLRQVMARDGLASYFQTLTFSNEHRIAKPNPRLFHLTLASLGVAPHQAVHVGDNPRTDVAGALGASMKAVWFRSRPLAESQVPGHGVITRLAQLPDLLAQWD